jgi:hypothetical protein
MDILMNVSLIFGYLVKNRQGQFDAVRKNISDLMTPED